MPRIPLPIDPLLPKVVETLRQAPSLVLEAPPGVGKTTRVPRALLESGIVGDKEILVLQPRRLPARLAAQRVAEEMGERVGGSVGFQMRFEDVGGPHTRLRFVTEGVLMRRLLSEPTLPRVGAVVLDEFHERHLHGDLGLALLKRLQAGARRDLKLLVMSATLDAAPIADFLHGCATLCSEGRQFDVALEHWTAPDSRPLEQQVLAALKRLSQAATDGDVLVFLPGAAEIRRAKSACEEFVNGRGWEMHVLHGELPPDEQDRAIRPSSRLKVILSTNVAESSVTIPKVAAVVDSGLARIASHSPWSGLPALKLAKISKASALQRQGRAGRTRSGKCFRLYTRQDFDQRPEHETPEIRRLDLSEAVLTLKASEVGNLSDFPFFEPPPAASLQSAEALLLRLGAIDAGGKPTSVGRRLLQLPLHPRLARVVAEGELRGVSREAATAAALISERDIRRETRGQTHTTTPGARVSGPSDVLELLDRFEQAERSRFAADRLRVLELDPAATQAVRRAQRQLLGLIGRSGPPQDVRAMEEALRICLLAGYPDRLARRRRPHAAEVILAGGGTAVLSPHSVVHDAELMVAVDVEEREGARGTVVRLASAVEPEWLLGLYPQEIHELDALEWNADKRQVERVTRLSYGDLTLEESRTLAPISDDSARLLAQMAWTAFSAGQLKWRGDESFESWQARLETAAKAAPQAGFPVPDEEWMRQSIEALCAGKRSFEELSELSLSELMSATLSYEQLTTLARVAPERISLPGGRGVKIHYEREKPAWIESRLQDFFGMAATPRIGDGKIPLVIHLLAPNQRAVQVTSDLSGFWERHYPALRRELMRKYPRHAWPEDPLHAKPPTPSGRRPPS